MESDPSTDPAPQSPSKIAITGATSKHRGQSAHMLGQNHEYPRRKKRRRASTSPSPPPPDTKATAFIRFSSVRRNQQAQDELFKTNPLRMGLPASEMQVFIMGCVDSTTLKTPNPRRSSPALNWLGKPGMLHNSHVRRLSLDGFSNYTEYPL